VLTSPALGDARDLARLLEPQLRKRGHIASADRATQWLAIQLRRGRLGLLHLQPFNLLPKIPCRNHSGMLEIRPEVVHDPECPLLNIL
jgi:hypothetical protein